MDTYKQKYEQALDNFKKIKAANKDNKELVDFIEYEYPELRESEDERIRKELIRAFTVTADKRVHEIYGNGITYGQVLAWLEKQGHEGKKWIYEDAYIKEKEQVFQDGIDEVLENPQRYGLEKRGEQKPAWSEEDEKKIMWLVRLISTVGFRELDTDKMPCSRSELLNWLKSLKERMKGE